MDFNIEKIADIRDKIRKKQNKKRYEHTLGVAYTAACLAFIYDEDPLRAELAGVLHDCAKCYPGEELISLCSKAGISLSKEEIDSPQVIHAKYGSFIAKKEYGITDQGILDAICFHTTGRPDMTVLEKIIFTADYIEPLRDGLPDLAELRKLAFSKLDECVFRILSQSVDYLSEKGAGIVPDTLKAYEWYKKEIKDHE